MATAPGSTIGQSTGTAGTLGLTSAEAGRRLRECGPNAVADTAPPAWRVFLGKLWAPMPWMLEVAIELQLALGEYAEAAVVGALLLINTVLGFVEEGRASAALQALKDRLAPTALGRRDGEWVRLAASELVPGDAIRLPLGARRCPDSGRRIERRPVDADRRVGPARRRPRQRHSCERAGAPWTGDRRSEGDRAQDPFRVRCLTGPRRPWRRHRAERRPRSNALPRPDERCGGAEYRRLRLCDGVADRQPGPPGPNRAAGHDPGGLARHLHLVGCIQRSDVPGMASY
jgi:hypothetical protein